MNIKARCFLCTLAVGLAVVASAAPALAVTKKLMHGSGCQWEDNTAPGATYTGFGAIQNDPAVVGLLRCPITRSNVTNTNGLTDLEVRLFALSGFQASVTCHAFSMPANGVGSPLKSVTKTASVGTSGVKMDFGAALNLGVANGSYSVLCFMPEGVSLVSVLWAEP